MCRQRVEQVALVHVRADGRQIAAGAPDGGRFDVDGVQRDAVDEGRDRQAHRTRTAGQVDDRGARPGQCRRPAGEQFGALARHEHTRVDRHAQPAELGPAHDVFERESGDPPLHHGREGRRCGRRVDEQSSLVLGEHATGGP